MTEKGIAPFVGAARSLQYKGVDPLLLGQGPSGHQLSRQAEHAALLQCSVLITGEVGTGKASWARLISKLGSRASGPFVPVNCAALTEAFGEGQLFGHERGMFAGAVGRGLGIFRAAEGGVVFLDGVSEMPSILQPKLIRVLISKEVLSVGGARPVPIDVQIIASSIYDLKQDAEIGLFSPELHERLRNVELVIPPLRKRSAEIPALVDFFSRCMAVKYDRPVWRPGIELLRVFRDYSWPGNLRQLERVIEQSYVLDCNASLPDS